MSGKVADVMLEMLADVGVQRCYGIVGDVPETIAIAIAVNADRGAPTQRAIMLCYGDFRSMAERVGFEALNA